MSERRCGRTWCTDENPCLRCEKAKPQEGTPSARATQADQASGVPSCDSLLDHIEAIEAELTYITNKKDGVDIELAEAKAEIARLKELRTRDAAEVVAWLAREAPELFERCKAALEKT